jgi:hypothetical protein
MMAPNLVGVHRGGGHKIGGAGPLEARELIDLIADTALTK